MTVTAPLSSVDTAALEREILRAHLSRRDFHKASQFISAAKACDNNVVREALLISALVCYTRPFSHGEIQQSSVTTFAAPTTSKALHDRLIGLRGRAVTEDDADAYPPQLEPSRRGTSARVLFTPHQFRSRTWNLLKEDIDLGAFIRLVDEMHGLCSERLALLSDELAQVQPFFSGTHLS